MRKLLAIGLLALTAPQARADSIGEESFLSGIGEAHPAVLASRQGVGIAEAAKQRAATLDNPRLEFWREEPDDQPRVTNWTVAWVPPLDGRYRLGKESAEKGLAAAQERFGARVAELRREAREAFAAWSVEHERLEVVRARLALIEKLERQQQERTRVGEESGLAARRFSLAADDARSSLRRTEARYGAAESAARAWRPEIPADATPAPLDLPAPPPSGPAGETPELRALALEAEQAEIDARRAGRFWGFPTLELGIQKIEDGSRTSDGPIFAAGWNIPLFDRDKASRLEAERRHEATTARLEWARVRTGAEIEGRRRAYETLFRSAQEARTAAREADRITEAATAAFTAGEASLTDLFDSLRAAADARLREVDARADANEVHRAYEAFLGRPITTGEQP